MPKIVARKLTSLGAESIAYSIEKNGILQKAASKIKIKPNHPLMKYDCHIAKDEYEIIVATQNIFRRIFNGKEYFVKPGNYWIMNPGANYIIDITRSNKIRRSMSITVNRQLIKDIMYAYNIEYKEEVVFKSDSKKISPHLKCIIDSLYYVFRSIEKSGSFMLFDLAIRQLATYLLVNHENNQRITEKFTVEKIFDDERIDKAIEFINENYNKDISLNVVAKASAVSKFHLVRLFKEATGKTPWQYLTTYRMQKAYEIIKNNPKIKVKELCFEVGFNHPEYFDRVFKKHNKKSVTDIKKEIQK